MARIAFIEVTATVSYGGVQTAVWKLAEALAAAGHEVAIFGGKGDIAPALAHPVEVHRFAFTPREQVPDLGSRFQRLVERLSLARHARAALAAGGFDWAIVNKPFDFFWPWIMPRGCRTRFAFMSGGTDYIPLDRVLVRRIDAVLSCSYFNAWQLRTRYRKRYPVVIYNGVDIERFSPLHAGGPLRQRLGVSADETLFIFAGRLVGLKGVAVAVRALAEEPLREVGARLLVVGDGPERVRLEQLASDLSVRARVIFHGALPHAELPALYAAADVGVFPSVGAEAFGIAIAEVMSCGKPVVASHIGGIPEVVGNEGSCGLLFAPGDAGALAQAMRRLALDPVRRTAMGMAARRRIEGEFTWAAAARRLCEGLRLR